MCVYVCQVGEQQKKESWSSPPLLHLAELAWAAINFHANHKGFGMNSGTIFKLCARVSVCTRLCVCASPFFFFFLQELAETKHHLHAAGCPDCLLLSPGQGRGSLWALLRNGLCRRCFCYAARKCWQLIMSSWMAVPYWSQRVETETNRERESGSERDRQTHMKIPERCASLCPGWWRCLERVMNT